MKRVVGFAFLRWLAVLIALALALRDVIQVVMPVLVLIAYSVARDVWATTAPEFADRRVADAGATILGAVAFWTFVGFGWLAAPATLGPAIEQSWPYLWSAIGVGLFAETLGPWLRATPNGGDPSGAA